MDSVTKRIAKYISGQKLSVVVISDALNIAAQKLQPETEETLTAEEFLRLCVFLSIKPEQFYEESYNLGER